MGVSLVIKNYKVMFFNQQPVICTFHAFNIPYSLQLQSKQPEVHSSVLITLQSPVVTICTT
jgi:hypothetical protein